MSEVWKAWLFFHSSAGYRTRCYFKINIFGSLFQYINSFSFFHSHAVCIFYLVLRALDTLEDDMTISVEKKVPLLHNFHSYLYEPDWRFMESKEKDRQVLEDFPTVEKLQLSSAYGCVSNWWCTVSEPVITYNQL